jgi:hypothetical protein
MKRRAGCAPREFAAALAEGARLGDAEVRVLGLANVDT